MADRCPTCGQPLDMQSKGGTARAAKLTKEERSEIARKGGLARQQKLREAAPKVHCPFCHSGLITVTATVGKRAECKCHACGYRGDLFPRRAATPKADAPKRHPRKLR